jgi:hypothetical protein
VWLRASFAGSNERTGGAISSGRRDSICDCNTGSVWTLCRGKTVPQSQCRRPLYAARPPYLQKRQGVARVQRHACPPHAGRRSRNCWRYALRASASLGLLCAAHDAP